MFDPELDIAKLDVDVSADIREIWAPILALKVRCGRYLGIIYLHNL